MFTSMISLNRYKNTMRQIGLRDEYDPHFTVQHNDRKVDDRIWIQCPHDLVPLVFPAVMLSFSKRHTLYVALLALGKI